MQSWMISIVIQFVLRQLAKFTTTIDWEKVKRDLDARIRTLIPLPWLDAEAISIVNSSIDLLKSILSDGAKIEPILQLLAQEKFKEAGSMLIDFLRDHLSGVPVEGDHLKIRNMIS